MAQIDLSDPKKYKEEAERISKYVPQSYPFNVERRRMTVYMNGGRSADGTTFEDLSTIPGLSNEVPRGFQLWAEVANSAVEMSLKFDWLNDDLTFSVKSKDKSFSDEVFGRLENWVAEVKSSRWLQFWFRAKALGGPTGYLLLLIYLILVPLAAASVNTVGPLHREAWQIVQHGVDDSNEKRAIQLILALQTDYGPTPVPNFPSGRFWAYFSLGALFIFGFNFSPKGAVGLWRGRQQIETQRVWIRFVSITAPLAIFSALVSELIHFL